MNIEEHIQRGLFSTSSEKSFVDKLLAKDDVDRLRELMRKEGLNRQDLLELLYMCISTESKLLNYSDWDRYVILKYFIWIREFMQLAEGIFDYKEYLDKQEKKGIIKLTPRAQQTYTNIINMVEHIIKFLVDVYLNIGRTSLSVGATGLLEILKNKYEIVYPNMPLGTPVKGDDKSGLIQRQGGKK